MNTQWALMAKVGIFPGHQHIWDTAARNLCTMWRGGEGEGETARFGCSQCKCKYFFVYRRWKRLGTEMAIMWSMISIFRKGDIEKREECCVKVEQNAGRAQNRYDLQLSYFYMKETVGVYVCCLNATSVLLLCLYDVVVPWNMGITVVTVAIDMQV